MSFADLAQHILHRNFAVAENERTSRGASNAHLVLFGANRETRKPALDDECRELFSIHFGKYGEQVREPGIGDPHFFAVQQVVLSVSGKLGLRPAVQGIGTRGRFRERVGANFLPSGQPGQILFLLFFGAEVDDRQCAYAGVCAPGRAETAIFGKAVGNDGRGDFVHLHAAILFGNVDAAQPEFARLPHQFPGDGEVLVFHFFDVGNDLFAGKFFRGLRDQQMLVAEIFRGENLVWSAFPDQEAAARKFVRYCSQRGHILSPLEIFVVQSRLRSNSPLQS